MGNNLKKILGFILISAVLVTSVIAAANEYAYSNVVFTVPTDTSFTVQVYGSPSANYSSPTRPGNQTPDIWFNSSDGQSKDVEPCLTGGTSCQSSTNGGILEFKNVGTTRLNFTVMWNESGPPSGIVVWANVTPGAGGCTGCIFGANGTQFGATEWNFSMNVSVNNDTQLWLYANFTDVSAGTWWRALNYTSLVAGI